MTQFLCHPELTKSCPCSIRKAWRLACFCHSAGSVSFSSIRYNMSTYKSGCCEDWRSKSYKLLCTQSHLCPDLITVLLFYEYIQSHFFNVLMKGPIWSSDMCYLAHSQGQAWCSVLEDWVGKPAQSLLQDWHVNITAFSFLEC